MNDSREEANSIKRTQKTDIQKSHAKKLRRFHFLLKNILRLFAIFGCFGSCGYFLVTSTNRIKSNDIHQKFKTTSSVDNVSLQITVCPVAPFEQVLALDFGNFTRRANNIRLRGPSWDLLNQPDFVKDFNSKLECIYQSQFVHLDDTIERKLDVLKNHTECMANSKQDETILTPGNEQEQNKTVKTKDLFTSNFVQDAIEINTWIRSYRLLYMLKLHKEHDVDFYTGIYKNIDILKQDNATLNDFLDSSARDLEDYITSDLTKASNINLNKPAQKIVMSSLRTRFGTKCISYTVGHEGDAAKVKQARLNQRYQLQMTFNRVSLAYLLVFVDENRTFSDIPGASILQPYRIPLDTNSILHIRRMERTKKYKASEDCINYDKKSSNGSQVQCMEMCLLKKVVTAENTTCLIPWMKRSSIQLPTNKSLCKSSDDFLKTRDSQEKIFSGNNSDCNRICKESCEKLNILVKIMGNVQPSSRNEDQQHSMSIIVSNKIYEFTNFPVYNWGEFVSEVFGSLSFFLGIAFVALIDWIFAALLWLCGKLPYIPAMPPIINSDIYLRDIYHHIRHELCGDPIPMTISQTYLKTHEHRRDAFEAVPSTVEKAVIDHRHPQFPRMNQRKSSLAILSKTFSALSHHHDERHLQEQCKSLSKAISRHESFIAESVSIHKCFSSGPPTVSSHQLASPSRHQPSKTTGLSIHSTADKWSDPRITISAPDEETDGTGQESRTADSSALPDIDMGSALPDIERQRRPSRAASVLRDLDAAEASRTAEASHTTEEDGASPATATVAKGRRRSSTYRTKPRRKSHAIAPAPAAAIPEQSDDEPPD